MVKREKFNGFDEKFPIAYNDVDLCFRLYERGFENVVANNVKLYHYESISRGNDRLSKEKKTRLYKERKALYKKHTTPGIRPKWAGCRGLLSILYSCRYSSPEIARACAITSAAS